jgi:hypothetical protein
MTQEIKIIVDTEVFEQVVQFVHEKFRRPKVIWFIFDVRRFSIANLIVEDDWDTILIMNTNSLTKCQLKEPTQKL